MMSKQVRRRSKGPKPLGADAVRLLKRLGLPRNEQAARQQVDDLKQATAALSLLREQLRIVESERQHAIAKKNETARQLAETQQTLEVVRADLGRTMKHRDELSSTSADRQRQLEVANARIEALGGQLGTAVGEKERLVRELTVAQDNLRAGDRARAAVLNVLRGAGADVDDPDISPADLVAGVLKERDEALAAKQRELDAAAQERDAQKARADGLQMQLIGAKDRIDILLKHIKDLVSLLRTLEKQREILVEGSDEEKAALIETLTSVATLDLPGWVHDECPEEEEETEVEPAPKAAETAPAEPAAQTESQKAKPTTRVKCPDCNKAFDAVLGENESVCPHCASLIVWPKPVSAEPDPPSGDPAADVRR